MNRWLRALLALLIGAGLSAGAAWGLSRVPWMAWTAPTAWVFAVIAGSREFESGKVSLKDMRLGRELSKEIVDREEWAKDQPAQVTVSMENLIQEVQAILDRYRHS